MAFILSENRALEHHILLWKSNNFYRKHALTVSCDRVYFNTAYVSTRDGKWNQVPLSNMIELNSRIIYKRIWEGNDA
jgi:hypothetical protein